MANPDVFSALGIFSGGVISVEEAAQAKGFREAYKLVFISFGSREVETPRYGHDPKVVTEELKASGMNAHYYVSPETAHEWQTWRRSLYQFAFFCESVIGLLSNSKSCSFVVIFSTKIFPSFLFALSTDKIILSFTFF